MTKGASCLIACATAALLPTLALALAAPVEPAAPSGKNVLVTPAIGHADGGTRKPDRTYRLIVPDGKPVTKRLPGAREPIAATTFAMNTPGTEAGVPITSYTDQNAGVDAEVRARIAGQAIGLEVKIEDGVIDRGLAKRDDSQPEIHALQVEFAGALHDGRSFGEIEAATRDRGVVYLEVTPQILE